MKIKHIFWLFIYYGFARFLFPTNSCFIGKLGGKLRNVCAKKLFKKCGNNINIEYMAHFGKGLGIEIGNNSGIGIHCHVPNDIFIPIYEALQNSDMTKIRIITMLAIRFKVPTDVIEVKIYEYEKGKKGPKLVK